MAKAANHKRGSFYHCAALRRKQPENLQLWVSNILFKYELNELIICEKTALWILVACIIYV